MTFFSYLVNHPDIGNVVAKIERGQQGSKVIIDDAMHTQLRAMSKDVLY